MARKKHKRLDAICENVFTGNKLANQKEENDSNGGGGHVEARRSGRVRRAPVILDASPTPSKKRRKIDSTGKRVNVQDEKRKACDDRVNSGSTSKGVECSDEGEPSGWKSRLRPKGRTVAVQRKKKVDSPRGKRKLFDFAEVVEQSMSEEEEFEVDVDEFDEGKVTVVKSKRTTRIEASIVEREGELDIGVKEHKNVEEEMIVVEMVGDVIEDCMEVEEEVDCENENVEVNSKTMQLPDEVETEIHNDLEVDKVFVGKKDELLEQVDKLPDQEVPMKEGQSYTDSLEIGTRENKDFEGGSRDRKESPSDKLTQPSNQGSMFKHGNPRIKEGRRCGLCGAATDGKPPKILAYDVADSENEVCSGSSASEEPNYDIWDGFGDEPGWLGRLLGPINDRFGIVGVWVHQHCAVWSPEVYFAGVGCLKSVKAALCRGRALKCCRCGRRGATIGCRVDRCPKTYHLPCARAEGCIFDHRKFLIACTDHRRLFQPQGNQYLRRVKKMKAKKIMLEIKKKSNEAWRKDVDAEEKWLEGEDEEFLKRESKRLHRDILRIAPVYIGGSEAESGKLFQGWESVAGLQDVIRCLKEVVILPLLYPHFFTNLGLTPPRGVLLHGYPGTGKTLVVRALIGACARGDKRIAYFARKGADCLGKYVGDAERQLRLLFQVAEKSQPSIIFFDEIDGLAPSRTRQQDQTHSSVVSTLLALMDGLKSRGSVIVIGATNRPEAVDPALRRPGRFDREIYFPLPSVKDRAAILSLHSQSWPKPLSGSLLKWIAAKTADFAGADLQALCTQAAMIALKRNCPLQKLLSAAEKKHGDGRRVPLPSFVVEERDWLEALSSAPPPCSHREAGMAANGVTSSPLPAHLFSCLMQPFSKLLVSIFLDERLCLPPPLANAARMIKNVIVTALNEKQVRSDFWWDHVEDLLQQGDIAEEIERKLSCSSSLVRDSGFTDSDVLNDSNGDGSDDRESSTEHVSHCNSMLRNTTYASGKNAGLRILIAGSPRSGQGHLARCLLHCFTRNIQILKVDLATTSQKGHGDVVRGLTEILMKSSSLASCVLFTPKIDLWATNTIHQDDEEDRDCSSIANEESEEQLGTGDEKVMKNNSCNTADDIMKKAAYEDDVNSVSYAWNFFMEQVDAISVSTSLMILATSDIPYQELPSKIRKFFDSEISKGSSSNQDHTFPRFSVQADGNFNRETLILSSAAKLSRDVVQQFLQLVHHGTHDSTTSCGEYKIFENEADVCCGTDHGPTNINTTADKVSEDYPSKVLPNEIRQSKGKSSLMVAISALGYQLLGYPHFAELCWVTSKLKDGPFSDVKGVLSADFLYKEVYRSRIGVIRPNNSVQPIKFPTGSSDTKINKKSYVVRGLAAVGLLAYKGVYKSATEVCLEIRKVLKLLVERINDKIQAGKDRHIFVRILSQVAYLEDIVGSWAYSLQSFEQDIPVENLQHNTPKSTDLNDAKATGQYDCPDNGTSSGKCASFPSEISSHELEMQEQKHGDLSGEDDSIHKVLNPENGGINFFSPSANLQKSCCGTVELGSMHSNTINSQSATPSENNTVENGSVLIKSSNGFALTESLQVCSKLNGEAVDIQNEGDDSNLDPATRPAGHLASTEPPQVCCKVNGNAPDVQNEGDIINLDSAIKPTGHIVCLYNFCTGCIQTVNDLMQKIVTCEWEQHGAVKTIEDVHDKVSSLSIDLLSALRREYATTTQLSDSANQPGHCDGQYLGKQSIVPMNCTTHSIGTAPFSQLGSNTKFIYKDGVLNPRDVDVNGDVSFHCKFETLSLSALINWMDNHFPKSSN